MSVLIKGMDEIPEDGAVLVVMHDNGKAYIKHACTYGYSAELVKLPETHGRLIDADALVVKYNLYAPIAPVVEGDSEHWTNLIHTKHILTAPTIIEAEDE